MYYRKKKGKGFSYTDENGKTVTDTAVKTYIKSLIIPPAWKDVEISEKKNSKILVTGRDELGRKQYIYNPKFRQKQEQKKFDRIIEFAEQLERIRTYASRYRSAHAQTQTNARKSSGYNGSFIGICLFSSGKRLLH